MHSVTLSFYIFFTLLFFFVIFYEYELEFLTVLLLEFNVKRLSLIVLFFCGAVFSVQGADSTTVVPKEKTIIITPTVTKSDISYENFRNKLPQNKSNWSKIKDLFL